MAATSRSKRANKRTATKAGGSDEEFAVKKSRVAKPASPKRKVGAKKSSEATAKVAVTDVVVKRESKTKQTGSPKKSNSKSTTNAKKPAAGTPGILGRIWDGIYDQVAPFIKNLL